MAFAVGLAVALVVGVFLLMGSGHDPLRVYERMFDASLGDPRAWSVTVNRAVPLGLAGLAVAVAGSMGLWNIGAEGQIMAGAIGAAWVARIGANWPGPVLVTAMLAAAVVGGGLLALGPAIARARIGVNEIITTLMLNEVASHWPSAWAWWLPSRWGCSCCLARATIRCMSTRGCSMPRWEIRVHGR